VKIGDVARGLARDVHTVGMSARRWVAPRARAVAAMVADSAASKTVTISVGGLTVTLYSAQPSTEEREPGPLERAVKEGRERA